MDVTLYYHLSVVRNIANKNYWKVKQSKKELELHISGLRLYAFKNRGSKISGWCNRESNFVEKQLNLALLN